MENEIIQKKKGKKKIILIVSFAIAAILISIIVAIMFAYLPLDNKTPYRKLNSFLVGDNKIFSKTQLNDDGYILFNATTNKNEVIMQFIHMVEVDGENDVLMGLNFYVEPKKYKTYIFDFWIKIGSQYEFLCGKEDDVFKCKCSVDSNKHFDGKGVNIIESNSTDAKLINVSNRLATSLFNGMVSRLQVLILTEANLTLDDLGFYNFYLW